MRTKLFGHSAQTPGKIEIVGVQEGEYLTGRKPEALVEHSRARMFFRRSRT